MPYNFQALQKDSLEDFNSALFSLLPRNYKHHVFLGYFNTSRIPKKKNLIVEAFMPLLFVFVTSFKYCADRKRQKLTRNNAAGEKDTCIYDNDSDRIAF